jgi:hypothetical protein
VQEQVIYRSIEGTGKITMDLIEIDGVDTLTSNVCIGYGCETNTVNSVSIGKLAGSGSSNNKIH